MPGRHLRDDDRGGDRRRWPLLLVALVLGFALGAGITLVTMGGDEDATVVGTGTTPDGAVSDRSTAAATPDAGPVTLAFVGDINAEGVLRTRLDADPAGFVGPFAAVLAEADLVVGNLEAAIAVGGVAVDKEYTFRVPPSILDALEAGGVDVVSVANNHGIDFGPDGLAETLAARSARTDDMVIGVGANEAEAFAPHVATVNGQTIAVIAATQILDGDLIEAWTAGVDTPGLASAKKVFRLVEEVERARATADTVVVFVHWGVETQECPTASQQELAATLVEAGADVVVGSHAHRLQGGGRLGDAFVGYGLGNFLFGAVSEASARTGVLLVTVDGRRIVDYGWRPGTIVDSVPMPLSGDEASTAVAAWDAQRGCTGLTP